MSISWPAKDPDEVLDYDLVWTNRLYSADELDLVDAGQTVVPADTIATSQWILDDGSDGLLVMDSTGQSDAVTKVWLSGGTLGQSYQLTNRVVTAGARTMDQSVRLKIKAK
jgi:hypothetical protein